MKKQILLFIFTTSIYFASAQNNSGNKTITGGGNVDIYTSLKPKDGQPAIFMTQAELNAKIQDKKDKTIALITASIGDTIKIQLYREQLWRFENAIVQGSRK